MQQLHSNGGRRASDGRDAMESPQIGKFAIGMYVGEASVGSTFGVAGSLAVLLVWVYYS